ncbi:hypothetical protein A2619_02355 [candidate division WWE3 bacterium RIFOXYD1_FULL_39_9]|uniref:Uncharacterized protein n=1 Tax=candidate division WWE3 bacterium RIFOXYD1_FULL_39_9 TaxID=1802649 RepID=A0A1F4X560_UNCKA|nr:MAG: hypothetical protein A2619_02355 [candidate division WWE3 bacterium RIFOXYD1_FULL_39_9]
MISMTPPARRSPCADCENKDEDKDKFHDCLYCIVRILYDYSIEDSRLLPRYILEDKERWELLKDVSIDDTYQTKNQTDYKLMFLSREAGFEDDFCAWLRYLYDEKKMSLTAISKKIKVSTGTIRRKLAKTGDINPIGGTNRPRKFCEPIIYCEECKKQIKRKRYDSGKLEQIWAFRKRKYCSNECYQIVKKRIAEEKCNEINSF